MEIYGSKDSIIKPVVSFFLVLIISSYATSDWDSRFVWSVYGGAIMPDVQNSEPYS
jgi:hypothetical protein